MSNGKRSAKQVPVSAPESIELIMSAIGYMLAAGLKVSGSDLPDKAVIFIDGARWVDGRLQLVPVMAEANLPVMANEDVPVKD